MSQGHRGGALELRARVEGQGVISGYGVPSSGLPIVGDRQVCVWPPGGTCLDPMKDK